MEVINYFTERMGAYAFPIVIGLLEIIFAIVLCNGFWYLNRKRKYNKRVLEGEKIYQRALNEKSGQSQMILRCKDKCPVFITKNVETNFKIDREKLSNNPEWIERLFGKNTAHKIINEYQNWNGTGELVQEYFLKEQNKWIQVQINRVLSGNYDFVVVSDISKEKEMIAGLEEQIAAAEMESKSKTTFLSRMSHEIRTPMNGIIGMLTLAKKSADLNSEEEVYLDKASELSQFLLSLINDILDMSRIEAGKIELSEDVIDLHEIADQLNDMFRKTVESKGVGFYLEMKEFDVRYVLGDELRLMQVIVNFLSNAVKFTSKGEIRVIFREMYRTDSQINMMISVQDTGKGMEPEFINRIFRPFEQENAKIQTVYGGTGLGMAITDQIVQLMGGKIVIDSFPQKGTNITVYLKMNLPSKAQIPESESSIKEKTVEEEAMVSLNGLHVLLVEDNEINAEIASSILQMDGIIIDHAENGKIAVDTFEASEENYYDVILMDIHMPVMNGIEAVQAIRALPRKDAGEVIIIALSADAFVEDRRQAIEAGMNEHLPKPIDFDELKKMIRRFLAEKKKGGE